MALKECQRERDELAAHVELLERSVKPLVGKNLAGAGPIITYVALALMNSPKESHNFLRAKHWREAAEYLSKEPTVSQWINAGIALKGEADTIERDQK